MEKPKQILARNRLEAKLLSALRQDQNFDCIEKVEVRRVDDGRAANWNLAKISPPIVLRGGTGWQSIKRAVSELQDRYDIEDDQAN